MNLYSNKQRWKIFLFAMAMVIVAVTLWYSKHIADRIREEEHSKVRLWSETIQRKAELVNFTENLFQQLRDEERRKADLLGRAYRIISDPNDMNDLTFVTEFLWGNTTIPVLIYDSNGQLWNSVNLPPGKENNKTYIDSLYLAISKKNKPIELVEVGQKIYYDDSRLFSRLQSTMDDLIHSFISETVLNSASVPVIVTDSLRSRVITIGNIDTTTWQMKGGLQGRLASMANSNAPIAVQLPGQGRQLIFYEDSEVLKQLKLFPLIQLILVGVFLLVSYLIFSTFRKAEQNQVWVGMAKETAHQLGTPLSALVGWSSYLESTGVDPGTLMELNKDIDRLNTITDRFSKIGSRPDLTEVPVKEVIEQAFDYLKHRVSKKVKFTVISADEKLTAFINKPLFGWVLENLAKNAMDAMDGIGSLESVISYENNRVCIDITDSGKGIPKHQWKTVFSPGFTTKKRGWGLGLSLAKRIVEEYHGGRIFVKWSEPGKGTTFRIELKG
jgi:two-component system, sporulation sensor kinase D